MVDAPPPAAALMVGDRSLPPYQEEPPGITTHI
jgi:hypothetical protein